MMVFFFLVFLPPLISGPLPTVLLFKMVSGPNWRRWLLLVIFSIILLNVISFGMVISNLEGLISPGFIACGLTPIMAVATLIVSLYVYKRGKADPCADPMQRKWLRFCLIAIPVLQMFMMTTLVLISPSLCNSGIRTCTNK